MGWQYVKSFNAYKQLQYGIQQRNAPCRRNASKINAYISEKVFKMMRIISNFALVINYSQINNRQLRFVPFNKSGDPIITQFGLNKLLSEISNDLRVRDIPRLLNSLTRLTRAFSRRSVSALDKSEIASFLVPVSPRYRRASVVPSRMYFFEVAAKLGLFYDSISAIASSIRSLVGKLSLIES